MTTQGGYIAGDSFEKPLVFLHSLISTTIHVFLPYSEISFLLFFLKSLFYQWDLAFVYLCLHILRLLVQFLLVPPPVEFLFV